MSPRRFIRITARRGQGFMMDYANILIIGAGPAGFAAAVKAAAVKTAALTAEKAAAFTAGNIGDEPVLAGAEPFPPYWRPRLGEVLTSGAPAEKLLMRKESWFAENGIRFLPSRRAAEVDPANRTVLWEDGTRTEYGSLVLATGALPNLPPIPHAAAVYPIRSFADALRVREACQGAGRAFIAGGGVLGLETAFALKQAGCRVTVAELADTLLPRQLDPEGGRFLRSRLEDAGLEIITGADFEALRDKIEGSCIVAAAGVRPDLTLAKSAGLKTSRGVLVDDGMRTSDPNIYACGDVAEFQGAVPGLMPTASAQGSVAGTNAAGGSAVYRAVSPSPMLRVAGISVLSIGSVCNCTDAAVCRRIDSGNYAMATIHDEKLTGAAFIGDTKLGNAFKKHIDAGTAIGDASSFDALLGCIGCA